MRIDFAYMEAMQAKARRERSEAMFKMLVAPLIALLKRLAAPETGRRMSGCSSRTC